MDREALVAAALAGLFALLPAGAAARTLVGDGGTRWKGSEEGFSSRE